jgi:protein TonB
VPQPDPKPVQEKPKPKTTPAKREEKSAPAKPPAKPAEAAAKPAAKPGTKPAQPSPPAPQTATKPTADTPEEGEPNALPQSGTGGTEQTAASSGGNEAPGRPEPAVLAPGTPVNIEDGSLKVTKKVPAEYPALSKKRREQGMVVLLADIASGRAESVKVERTSGHARLDEAAMRAVREWRFDTSSYGPRVTARIPFKFELK